MAKNRPDRVFPTKYDESVEIGTFESFRKPSMTEPDNAMSIPEIIARFTRGYGIPVDQHPWTSGSAFPDENPEDLGGFLEIPQQQAEAPADRPSIDAAAPIREEAQEARKGSEGE